MTYTVKITKDGNTRSFGFNTAEKAGRFANKMVREGFDIATEARPTLDILREAFPEKFAAVVS
jgi:hypothetical protein